MEDAMNNTIRFSLLGLAVLLLLVGCTQPTGSNSPDSNPPNNPGQNPPTANVTVRITAQGYEPQNVSIPIGGTVTWVNETDTPNWPATARHPTHTEYPGSGIEKCGSPEALTIFDACRGLAKGERYSFMFNDAGEWSYHEHLGVKMFGKITVTS